MCIFSFARRLPLIQTTWSCVCSRKAVPISRQFDRFFPSLFVETVAKQPRLNVSRCIIRLLIFEDLKIFLKEMCRCIYLIFHWAQWSVFYKVRSAGNSIQDLAIDLDASGEKHFCENKRKCVFAKSRDVQLLIVDLGVLFWMKHHLLLAIPVSHSQVSV